MSSALKQTAVYWANPQSDGATGRTFDDPVEIPVRWEDRQELFLDDKGQERMSRATVIVDRDVARGGWLYLGDLDDLSSGEEADPLSVDEAHEIRQFTKTPDRSGTSFFRTAML
jgi:hypothetical protein